MRNITEKKKRGQGAEDKKTNVRKRATRIWGEEKNIRIIMKRRVI
jgi:hypothetical protein